MKYPKHILKLGVFLGVAALMASCGRDPNDPGLQFSPEMYESIPYDSYRQVADSVSPFANRQYMQTPPDGTVPVDGHMAFEFGDADSIKLNDPALIALPNPVELTPEVLTRGEVLYQRFCGVCHGKKGKGDGPITANSAIAPKPYTDPLISKFTPGQLYHTIMYGKNAMGSYAGQLDYNERWEVVHFVQTLQGTPTVANDSTAVDSAAMPAPAQPAVEPKPVPNGKGKGKNSGGN
jgi:mono/diheme cytochrome c family protein